ncbi:MAG TPA: BadF/BadG/BcrA/BcrD ATPase family protein [Aridibacter sp.]|nr:BadF/BadG/BcrA/BcrD ATPase family protein [Aridibacter sp.]
MSNPSRRYRRAAKILFLGVDGGGTKTQTVVYSADGEKLSEDTAGPSNPLRIGLRPSADTIFESATRACDRIARTTGGIAACVAGLAGVRREDLRDGMRRLIGERLPGADVSVVTDAEIALLAATGGKPGIVVIAGTGSIVFGRNSKGRSALAGGWGPIAGDEGGAVSIAREALRAVARASDGRGPKTVLSALAAEYFRASSAEDLIVAIYSPQMNYTRLAGFARHVAEAATEGDDVAATIVRDAGKDLGAAACAVIRRLRMERSNLRIGTVGGVFGAGDLVRRPLLRIVRSCAAKARIVEPVTSPAEAAAALAISQFKGKQVTL